MYVEVSVFALKALTASLTGQNGEKLGYAKWGRGYTKEFGAPYYHIHVSRFEHEYGYPG